MGGGRKSIQSCFAHSILILLGVIDGVWRERERERQLHCTATVGASIVSIIIIIIISISIVILILILSHPLPSSFLILILRQPAVQHQRYLDTRSPPNLHIPVLMATSYGLVTAVDAQHCSLPPRAPPFPPFPPSPFPPFPTPYSIFGYDIRTEMGFIIINPFSLASLSYPSHPAPDACQHPVQ